MPTTTRRKIGIEPLEVDLVVGPTVLTVADRQEIDTFFQELRKQNDKNPAVQAIRKQLAGKKREVHIEYSPAPPFTVPGMEPNPYAGVIVAPRFYGVDGKKAAPAAKRTVAPAAKRAVAAKKKR
jgi:hypothetical protein